MKSKFCKKWYKNKYTSRINMAFFFFTFVTRLYIVPCIFKSHAEYIRQNVRLYEAQAGTRSAGRNINNLW